MIWLKSHIQLNEKLYEEFFSTFKTKSVLPNCQSDRLQLAVVGAGPKGLYAVDSLFNELRNKGDNQNISLHWWTASSSIGPGPNYCIHQPEYWLINNCIGHVDAWMPSHTRRSYELSMLQWLDKFKMIEVTPRPTDFASRALVGCYLQYVAYEILKNIPDQVELIIYTQAVQKIYEQEESILTLASATEKCNAHSILMATGHCYSNQSIVKNRVQTTTLNNCINTIYPASQLDAIPDQVRVGIIGMGLSFVDAALHLTEGRGGKFDDSNQYRSSGKECILYPFSRSNLLMVPRGPVVEEASYQLNYLTPKWQDKVRRLSASRKLDFVSDVLPLLSKEFEFAYYSTLLSQRDERKVYQYIAQLNQKDRFNFHEFIFKGFDPAFTGDVHSLQYLEYMIAEAEKGELSSPLIAASAVWRLISPFISEIYAFGGFNGSSQQLLDQKYLGAFNRISYGPPIVNMQKIASLIQAGYIHLQFDSNVEVTYDSSTRKYLLSVQRQNMEIDYLVDARMAKPDLKKNNSTLYNYMWQQKLIEPLDNQGYHPGCMQLDASGSTAIKNKKYSIYAYGTNTEGALLDNDSLSRLKNNLTSDWLRSILIEKTNQKSEYYESKKHV